MSLPARMWGRRRASVTCRVGLRAAAVTPVHAREMADGSAHPLARGKWLSPEPVKFYFAVFSWKASTLRPLTSEVFHMTLGRDGAWKNRVLISPRDEREFDTLRMRSQPSRLVAGARFHCRRGSGEGCGRALPTALDYALRVPCAGSGPRSHFRRKSGPPRYLSNSIWPPFCCRMQNYGVMAQKGSASGWGRPGSGKIPC